jgi:hypothetical protein
VGSEWGVSPGVDSVISDAAGVWDTGGSKTGRLRPYWGELGGWDMFGAVLVCLGACSVVPELWLVFQRGPEQGIRLSSTNMSTMTWRIWWTHEALWWARCA